MTGALFPARQVGDGGLFRLVADGIAGMPVGHVAVLQAGEGDFHCQGGGVRLLQQVGEHSSGPQILAQQVDADELRRVPMSYAE